MSSRSHERRTDRATAEEVAEVERQLWEFAKRIDPPSVPEAKLRPGAFLWRVHRTWHSLGRGTGGLASRSFRALRDELLKRDPPVRNLQPKLYGNTFLSRSEAEQLTAVILATWHLERNRSGNWQAKPIMRPGGSKAASSQDLEAIRENLLQTLFKGDDNLLLEEPVGLPPEVFMEERGRSSVALIIPTKSETTAHLSPSNAYGGFSHIVGNFFDAAMIRKNSGASFPLLIWVLKIGAARDNAKFHQDFHCLATYSACISNWYYRLSRDRSTDQKDSQNYWNMILQHCAFFIHGLPDWAYKNEKNPSDPDQNLIDEDLADLEKDFFVPDTLPMILSNHRIVKRMSRQYFGLNVSVESHLDDEKTKDTHLVYWLFPESPREDLEETAETTGLPVFDAEMSPGSDYDLAYNSIHEAAAHYLGIRNDHRSLLSLNTLLSMKWNIFTILEFQQCLAVASQLGTKFKHGV